VKRLPAFLLCAVLAASGAAAQDPTSTDPTSTDPTSTDPMELINVLLSGLMGFTDMTGPELQGEVAAAGGIPFRSDVIVEYMTRAELAQYLKEVLDSEYPVPRADADQRTLLAFDLLPAGSDLRAMRARVLEENIVGFYDERPGKKRLYAVSAERKLTPANQLILSHELRHALQDQYVDLHATLPASVGDFDDRRLAFLSMLEGDATLVMERFLIRRLTGGEEQEDGPPVSMPVPPMPNVPDVIRDQLLLPYFEGREFAQALQKKGGWEALKEAWVRPPESTEQVLHPEKYDAREAPRTVDLSYAPGGGRVLNEGVLGEVLIKTFLGEGASDQASSGWGGDRYRVFDVSGKTLLVWRSVWDAPADVQEFLSAAQSRLGSGHTAEGSRRGFHVFASPPWRYAIGERAAGVDFVSSDDAKAFEAALAALGGS
jgi:hypothetical protein